MFLILLLWVCWIYRICPLCLKFVYVAQGFTRLLCGLQKEVQMYILQFVVQETDIEESSQSELSIYPNPTHTLITIETEYPDHYSINITTLNGQQILIGEMEGTSHQIDLSSFESGVYFITIRSKDFVTTRKIVKLRDH